ncbi:MAG: hypothetical protein ACFFAU_00195 [Candidatus Hodarchaeota archaeon]
MKERNNFILRPSSSKTIIPTSDIAERINFSYPQSSLLLLGDYRRITTVPTMFNRLIVKQFKFCLYIVNGLSDLTQSLLKTGSSLYNVSQKAILDGSIDSEILIDLFEENPRAIISVEGISPRLRLKYWKMLSLHIRNFFFQKKVPIVPYFMVWFDKNLTAVEPQLFEHFRIIGLWGEEFGLRFKLSLDHYASLTSPARQLFGILVLFPGILGEEVKGILNCLPVTDNIRNELYKQYQRLNRQQMLIVSPSGIFDPFLSPITV